MSSGADAGPSQQQLFETMVGAITAQLDADILVFSGDLRSPRDTELIEQIEGRKNRHPNVLLVVATYGGDPAVAYRIARMLQHTYKKFTAFVPGYCKSAGTLLILGAHELIVASHAELGPLDIQVLSKVETNERGSVLTLGAALASLDSRVKYLYRQYFDALRRDVKMSTRLAAQTATMLVTRMYRPLLSQIDPMRLGEFDRANQLAIQYGTRLIAQGKNITEDKLFDLVMMYPSHDFVIDMHEAKTLFKHVREAMAHEQLFSIARYLLQQNAEVCSFWDVPTPPTGGNNVKQQPAGPPTRGGGPDVGTDGSPARGGGEGPSVDTASGEPPPPRPRRATRAPSLEQE